MGLVGVKDSHPSRGYLTLLQRSVRHSIEPIRAFVFEDNAARRIKAIVGASDSEEGHRPGMCACAPLCRVLRHVVRAISRRPVVITVQSKIIAEEPTFAHLRRRGGSRSKESNLFTRISIFGIWARLFDAAASLFSIQRRRSIALSPVRRSETELAPTSRTFSRRLQLAPGLEPPSSWSLSPCYGPATICALNHRKVQPLTRFVSSFSDLREILRSVFNRDHVPIDYGSRSESVRPADRRKVDPPIEVESAWSLAGTLDWRVKERPRASSGSAEYAGKTDGSGGSKLLIFGPSQEAKRPRIKSGCCCAERSRRSLGPDRCQPSRCPSRWRFPAG
jgi:hypothetical protein